MCFWLEGNLWRGEEKKNPLIINYNETKLNINSIWIQFKIIPSGSAILSHISADN